MSTNWTIWGCLKSKWIVIGFALFIVSAENKDIVLLVSLLLKFLSTEFSSGITFLILRVSSMIHAISCAQVSSARSWALVCDFQLIYANKNSLPKDAKDEKKRKDIQYVSAVGKQTLPWQKRMIFLVKFL